MRVSCDREFGGGIWSLTEVKVSEAQLFASMTFPEIYERVLVQPLFRPFAEAVVERLKPVSGDSLIDVACGTGIVARIARQTLGPGARIVAVDVAAPMLAVARTVDASIDWREGNAVALPVREFESFSLLACHQGLQFFPDRPTAVREMRRVLAPNGRAAIACWSSLLDLPAMAELNEIAGRHVGPIVDSRHSFGNANDLRGLVTDGGFKDVTVETFAHDVRFADGRQFATLNAMAVIGMTEQGKKLNDSERRELAGQIAAESDAIIVRRLTRGEFVLPLSTNVAIARA
jgi:ubiquinone/menaquinone biosynthesis C-methylase UbiE